VSVLATRTFWLATAERAVRTVAQVAAASLGVAVTAALAADTPTVPPIDWWAVAQVSLLAGLLSVLMSIGGGSLTATPGPSLIGAERITEPERPDDDPDGVA
jgi:hypothetical protein